MSGAQMSEPVRELDLVCIGRMCVDLYAEQYRANLDEVESFSRYLGGSAANICYGAARLGLRTAMVARVGDDQNGQFIRRTLERAGVSTQMVVTDPKRLTPAVFLAVQPWNDFPRLFHYHDSADMATEPTDLDEAQIKASQAVLLTGSFLANPQVRATTLRALDLAQANQVRVVLDIDYRPVLWGLSKAADGNQMALMADRVSNELSTILPHCDLIVGTADEIAIAGGTADVNAALRAIRAQSGAAIVMKVGSRGCIVFEGEIPEQPDQLQATSGFEVDVVNSVGAGDGFFAGFLSGWLRGLPLGECARRGNAVGAVVVSRHGCSVAMPSTSELEAFTTMNPTPRRPSEHPTLRQLHRRAHFGSHHGDLHVLAIDHRWQLETMAQSTGASFSRIGALKRHFVASFRQVLEHRSDVGILLDDTYGALALDEVSDLDAWTARAIDLPGSRPVAFEVGREAGTALHSWPRGHVAKLMVYAHPGDDPSTWLAQIDRMQQLADAARAANRQFLIEFQVPKGSDLPDDYLPTMLERAYENDITPDWWKLPPIPDPDQWHRAGKVIRSNDPTCQGMLVLGQDSSPEHLAGALKAAASEPLVRGFAIGRAIFGAAAEQWMASHISDQELIAIVRDRFLDAINQWQALR